MIEHKGHYLVYISGWKTQHELYECIHCKVLVRKHNVVPDTFIIVQPQRFVGTCDEEKIRSIIE